jgi:phage-related protein
MASTRSRIIIEIEAQVEGFRDAVRGAEVQLRRMAAVVKENDKFFDRLGTSIGKSFKALAAIGAIGNAAQLVAGLTASLSNLVPIVALAPALVFSLVAAFATFKLATAGFADAVGGDAKALANLAPAARETVVAIQALKPQFEALRKTVQQEFFKNFAADVKILGATYLPILEAKLPRIAAAFNAMGRSITRALTTNGAADDINIALTNTAKLLENARNAVGHLVAGFIPLIAVGSTYLPNLGTAIDGAADKFRAWSQRVTSDGSLRDWVDGAIREFGFLHDVIVNIGDIFSAVFTGLSQGAGKDFLQTLADSTRALADFLGQAEQQDALKALGKAFTDVATVTREVFLEALKQLSPIIVELAPVISEIARVVGDLLVNALKIVGPLLLDVARFLNDNKQAVADLAPLVLALWVAFKGASVLTGVIGSLRGLTRALGGPINLLKAGGIIALGALAIKIDEINVATAKVENRPLNDMEDTLHDLVGAGQEILTLDFDGILSDISSELTEVHDKFLDGTSPIGAFKDALTEATVAVRDFVVNAATDIGNFFTTTLPEKVGEVGTAIEGALTTAATSVSDFFTTTVPQLVSDFFTSIGTGISTGASNIGQTVSDAFTTVVDTVKAKVQETVTAITDFLSQTPYQIGFAIGVAIGEVITRVQQFGTDLHANIVQFMTDFGTQIQDGITNAVTFFSELPGRVGEAISGLTETLATKAQEAGQAFLDWIGSFFDQTTTRAGEVPGQVGGAVAGTVDQLREKAIAAGTEFLTWLSNKFNDAVTFAQGVPGRIGAAVASVVGLLRDKAIEAGTSFVNGLRQKFDEAIEFVKTIPQRLVAAIGNLGTLLVGAGKALMDGLLNGIKSAYQGVKDFVSGIADGLKAIKGPLPYDRVVLRPAGLALMDGLLSGLQEGNRSVQAFVGTIADQMADPFGAGSTGTLTAQLTAAPGARVSNMIGEALASRNDGVVTVHVLLDGQPVAAIARATIEKADRDTVRAARAGAGVTF